MTSPCGCCAAAHETRLVVLTGGPGAGKTSVLELIRRSFCAHVAVLPEAAGIVFGGGFPRGSTLPARRAAQRAIYRVQCEVERLVLDERQVAVALCDRGTVDGVAYWPDEPSTYWKELGTHLQAEVARYAAVIHLRTPSPDRGYDNSNPHRVEDAAEAAAIDRRIAAAWRTHPRRSFVENEDDFLRKAARAVALVREEVPECCRTHRIPEVDGAPRVRSKSSAPRTKRRRSP